MITIDQNSAINSLNESLVPNPFLIDGRTEQDWLCFLSEFGTLINFYNDTNTIEGNWSPFLLKDPVFLMASISKTNYKNLHSIYKNSCAEIQQLDQKENDINLNSDALNKLFDHLTSIYKIIERWTHYMQGTDEMYDLKNYVIHEVKTKYSIDFWAVQSFRQYLYAQSMKGINVTITTAPQSEFSFFNSDIWKNYKDKKPFWEVFGFEKEESIINQADSMTSFSLGVLTTIGDRLFHFLETVIHHSTNEFKKLSHKKSRFPDTTLLRSFINVLKAQQNQLNGISQRHLDFYYTEILKQTELPATADNVFLCAALAKNNAVYSIPSGTLFDAGIDEQKNPVLFVSQKNVNLNPASIVSVQTVCYQNLPNASAYNLQSISKPTSVQKDVDDKILSWPTFGEINPTANPLPIGMAFASPMLLLREGQRNITLSLEFDATIDLSLLQGANYFLSTQKDWLKLELDPSDFTLNTSQKTCIVAIKIDIKPTQIAIEPFLVNPDGLHSEWPMIKILFHSIANPNTAPKVISITITVAVSGIKSCQLYNDYGELSTKNPFPPFGPIPLANSNFIIGNSEILSKPLDSFQIDIDWDKLPSDFEMYYDQYNNYLDKKEDKISATKPDKKDATKALSKIVNIISSVGNKPKPIEKSTTYNNSCFTVDFNLLQEKSWQEFKMSKSAETDLDKIFVPIADNPNPILLFDLKNVDPTKTIVSDSSSSFVYNKPLSSQKSQSNTGTITPDPSIQNKPLKFDNSVTSGFIKMILTGPEYGFGSEIYSKIVTNIALQNANSLAMAKGKKEAVFIAAANVPFVPKIKTFSASYSASVTYKFDDNTENYPLQYFLYSPFTSYPLFDNSIVYESAINTAIVGSSKTDLKDGLPLYPSFGYTGALFIELDHLIGNSSLNLYFQLARNSATTTSGDSVSYFYLSDSGWNEIHALSDGTNQFKCSGIIELPIPSDCSNSKNFMPGTNNWISIVVSGKLDTYSKTTFLQTNGFSVQRSGTSFLSDTINPQINSNTISKPQTVIPQIATFSQPFASFGGKAAESATNRNQRVSNSLKTKNRAITTTDYYTLITQKYDAIYYLKVVNKKSQNSCNVYLAKKLDTDSDANAFVPLVTNCLEDEIKQFLKENSSPFANLNVSNFNFEYVCVSAQIGVESGYQTLLLHNTINRALNLYLSPWIASYSAQIEIDKPLTDAKVTAFIKTIEGVATVDNVSFSSYCINPETGIRIDCKKNKTMLRAYGPTTLLVPALKHDITF
ncbi:hypothetical protein [Flavobacterium sp. N3904]|uniref:hypothetical protein n=1 Tax=Flavobacterium sp. N3904 TaxID=2986835 RepID=UPI002224DA2E|nr:hypothetical protein [Flavobacterium sp. N3904]